MFGEAGLIIQHALEVVEVEHKQDQDQNQWQSSMEEHAPDCLLKQELAAYENVQVSYLWTLTFFVSPSNFPLHNRFFDRNPS